MIGEGEKDDSHGLFYGEVVGRRREEVLHGSSEVYEICVDPIEGTRPTAQSGPEALSVLGVADFDGALLASKHFYSLKLAYGPRIARQVELYVDTPFSETLCKASKALDKSVDKIVVCVLDRPRHKKIIEQIRNHGARLKLIQDCDVSGALATCLPDSGVDLYYGVGGTPEAVIAACAMKCMGGRIQAQLADNDGTPRPGRIYMTEDLVRGDCVFAATGITNGSLLRGVRFTERGSVTHSVFMRSRSGTIRWLRTEHGNGSVPARKGEPR
ncbi:MAG: fructose-bisphosphatase class II family protein [Isosphaeraceae bacterium]